jgi:hypothetical protein
LYGREDGVDFVLSRRCQWSYIVLPLPVRVAHKLAAGQDLLGDRKDVALRPYVNYDHYAGLWACVRAGFGIYYGMVGYASFFRIKGLKTKCCFSCRASTPGASSSAGSVYPLFFILPAAAK